MWVLLLIVVKTDGAIIAYDQGRFDQWSECRDTGVAMVSELGDAYTSTCVELPKREK